MVKKYYSKLFKEYCIADLSRYKENKVTNTQGLYKKDMVTELIGLEYHGIQLIKDIQTETTYVHLVQHNLVKSPQINKCYPGCCTKLDHEVSSKSAPSLMMIALELAFTK